MRLLSNFLLVAIAVTCVSSQCVFVQADPPSLERLSPPVGARGTSFEVVAIGSDLSEVDRVLFYQPGLRCESIESISEDQLKLVLSAEDSAALVAHPIRLTSPSGISELRTITISPFPLVAEIESESPQAVTKNSTIHGTIQGTDTDDFLIDVQEGGRLSAEVVAVRLGVNLLDTELTLFDPDGQEILKVDDAPLLNQDPCFSIRVPKTGQYRLRIQPTGRSADADSPYALHIGDFPRPTAAFPMGGRAGDAMDVTFFGVFGDANDACVFPIGLPVNAGVDAIELVENGVPCPSPYPFRVTDFLNATSDTASSPHEAPVSFHGVVDQEEIVQEHTVVVPTGGLTRFEIFASRLGSPLDAVMDVLDARGRIVATGDDFESHDPRVVVQSVPGQMFRIRIRDKRAKHSTDFRYRLEVTREDTPPVAFLPRRDKLSQKRQTLSIPKGNRVLALMGVRRERSQGSMELNWPGLPDGVRMEGVHLPDGTFLVPNVLSADSDAELKAALIAVVPVTENRRGRFRQVVDLVNGPADAIYEACAVDRLAVAVVEEVPYSIEVAQPTSALPIDGTLDIEFKVHRKPGFSAPLDVAMALPTEWVDCDAKVRVPESESKGILRLRAGRKAIAKTWPLVLEATVAVGGTQSETPQIGASERAVADTNPLTWPPVCTSLRSLSIAPSPVRGELFRLAAEAGSNHLIHCRWEAMGDLPERMTATLEGLPNRVQSKPVSIERGQTDFSFDVEIPDDAPIGRFNGVFVRFTGELQGESVSYCLARDVAFLITPRGKLVTDASGRPLTPLETIRMRNANNQPIDSPE